MSKYRWKSMNAELSEGATDGTVKKLRPNTSSLASNDAAVKRAKAALPTEDGYFGVTGGSTYKPEALG